MIWRRHGIALLDTRRSGDGRTVDTVIAVGDAADIIAGAGDQIFADAGSCSIGRARRVAIEARLHQPIEFGFCALATKLARFQDGRLGDGRASAAIANLLTDHAGHAYLSDLSRLFRGQIMLIAAAYNAGENRVIDAGGIPAIAETVNYTALVTNTYFGFDRVIGDAERRARQSKGKSLRQSGQVIVSASSDASSPVPINNPSEPTATKTWLGGSVLYVQQ